MDFALGHPSLKNQHGDSRRPKIPQAEHWYGRDGSNNNKGSVVRIYICICLELQGIKKDPTPHYEAQNWVKHYHPPFTPSTLLHESQLCGGHKTIPWQVVGNWLH
jgi:hypothetical protein